jgi:patatin-like phospholipase/acyl hydrolase
MDRKIRVLSIDGGGIRGIIPGQVLVSLEEKLKRRTENDGARIADHFDLIAGTSTGGILTCLYLCPEEGGERKRPRFTAEEAVNLYLTRGGYIFDLSLWQIIKSAGGILDEKYDAGALEAALDDYFGELKLSDLIKPCLVTAYDIEDRSAKFFTQHDAIDDKEQDYYVKDVARATSAAPVYFEPEKVNSLKDVSCPLIDGGVFANNPTLCAYAEVRHKFPGRPRAKDMAILSLGTGYIKKKYEYEKAKDWGAISWIRPVIDILMSGVAEVVDYQIAQIYDAIECPAQYLRINSDLKYAKPEMDCVSGDNLENLKREGIRIAAEFDAELDAFIEFLL